jgi:2-phospho-L-lactate/phosphoenolpyruvate guanylyltransferase
MRASRLVWSVVIPVKVLAGAKTRLTGLVSTDRAELALAMAADTVRAALACQAAGAVIVVTDDAGAAAACAGLGAEVIADRPAAGLNPALRHGARHAADRWPGRGLAALAADLPALRPSELQDALAAAGRSGHGFVADAGGSGTTMYAAGPGLAFRPLFGPHSRHRHAGEGAAEISLPASSGLRRDVDTLADLRAAATIGLGPRSAALLTGRAELTSYPGVGCRLPLPEQAG